MTVLQNGLMFSHLRRVQDLRKQVASGELNPAAPTHFGCGSDWKMALFTIRDELGIPLFVDGDNPDTDCDIQMHLPGTKPRRMMIGVPRVRNMRVA